MTAAIEVRGLRKTYRAGLGGRAIDALAGIDLAVQPGELFGLLGPNGAGKTTTVKILLGLTHATAGERVAPRPSRERSREPAPRGLPARGPPVSRLPHGAPDAVRLRAHVGRRVTRRSQPRIPDLLARVKLSDWIDVKVKKFSKGMTQRLGLASALVHEPEVLLLDEPTDGVDPVGRREIRDLLRAEAAKGRAILLNSHLLSEIELTCDRVAVLRKGKVAAIGTVEELTKRKKRRDSLNVYKLVASPLSDEVLAAFPRRAPGPSASTGTSASRPATRSISIRSSTRPAPAARS